MNLKYVGGSTALNFMLGGENVRVTPNEMIKLTDEQADEIKNHAFANALLEQKMLVLTGQPKTEEKSANKADTAKSEATKAGDK